jgi:predicted site-specific integrase-resolvase
LRQTERCQAFCAAKGLVVEQTIKEIASGVNDKRSKLLSLFDKIPKRIVVEHKDRLTRFGFNYFEKLLPLLGYELIVINRDFEEEKDLIKDMIAIVTSFCCRLYGLKRGKSKSKKIKEIIGDASDD